MVLDKSKLREYSKRQYEREKDKHHIRNYRYNSHKKKFIDLKNNKCEICSSTDNLEIHHKKYTLDYSDWELLCMSCHKKKHVFLRKNKSLYKDEPKDLNKKGGSSSFMLDNQTKKRIKCSHCGYDWETSSDLVNVTCPSCNKKTPNKEE